MEYLSGLLDWIGAHAAWAGPVVFLVALTESLALVGLVVPGALLMFGVGALIGSGRLDYWPVMLAAVAGAIIGDLLSYLLGRWLGPRLPQFTPFRQRPGLLERGIAFFRRHGAMSIVLGRFVGPLRPVIPTIAGMLGMPAGQFLFTNVLSAIVWAPAYLLPGQVLAASANLAAAVTGRLLLLGLAAVALGWLLVFGLRRLIGWLGPTRRRGLWFTLALLAVLGGFMLGRLLSWSPVAAPQMLTWQQWQQQAWELSPLHRQGPWGVEEPFALQVAAWPVELARALVHSGWHLPESFDLRGALLWLSPEVDLIRVPPLPRRHAGRSPDMTYVRAFEGDRLVLRGWRSELTLQASGRPIWLVTVEREALFPDWPWLERQPRAVPAEAVAELRAALAQQVEVSGYVEQPPPSS